MVNSEYLSYSKLKLHFTITYDLIIPSKKYAVLRRVPEFIIFETTGSCKVKTPYKVNLINSVPLVIILYS